MDSMKVIEVFTEEIEFPWKDIDENWLIKIGESICEKLFLSNVTISLIMTSNEYIKNVNRDYRKKNTPTDVISFAYREEPFPQGDEEIEELGDIYISLERALEQSVEYEVTLKEEVKRLLIHGILHLIGYDHETSPKDEETMRAKEDELFESVSI